MVNKTSGAELPPYASIRIREDLKSVLDSMIIESGGVTLQSYDDKIRHLAWHYRHYKNNNHER